MRVTVGFLSFLLPGLGQLFQRDYLKAMGFLFVFGLLTFMGLKGPYFYPIVALVSAAQAYRAAPPTPMSQRLRVGLYGVIGFLGCLGWLSGVISLFFFGTR